MSIQLKVVLAAVGSKADQLRASLGVPPKNAGGRRAGDAVIATDLKATIGGGGAGERQVPASLLLQSYAQRIGALRLAAFAVGLFWLSPALRP